MSRIPGCDDLKVIYFIRRYHEVKRINKAKGTQVLSQKKIQLLTCSPEPKGVAGHYPAGIGEYAIQTLLIHYLQGHFCSFW